MKKCALITGASRGIGKAIALQLAKDHSYHILINYSTNTTAANTTKDQIIKEGGSAEVIQFNVQNKLEVSNKLVQWKENNPEQYICQTYRIKRGLRIFDNDVVPNKLIFNRVMRERIKQKE